MSNKLTREGESELKENLVFYCPISSLYLTPFRTQLSFQIPTHTLHSLLQPLTPAKSALPPFHLSQALSSLSSLERPDSLEFTIVSYHLPESPLCLDNNPQCWDSPHIPSPPTPRLSSSTRKGTKRTGYTSYSCFLISAGHHTLHQLWNNHLFSVSNFLCSSVP